MEITLTKKQNLLRKLITSQNIPEINVLGSTQSGKTFSCNLAVIEYAEKLYNYAPKERFYGAIIGWTTDTLKRNVADNIVDNLKSMGFKKDKDYIFKWGQQEKFLEIYNLKIYFFGFNNYLSFNKILGAPLIFVWVDEAARIYSVAKLQESFDQIIGRQISYAGHPYLKTIHTFNVEGGSNHPYKVKYIDNNDCKKLVFFPYDNPKLNTKEKIREVLKMFSTKTLKEQKIFNKWVVSEGKVFNKVNVTNSLENWKIREIGIGVDYGSKNSTTFVPYALAYNTFAKRWGIVRLQVYYHNPQKLGTTPTTEYFSNQLRLFIVYLKNKYGVNIPIYDLVVDSEALHFINRLNADNIPNVGADKYPGSVKEGVEYIQSLFEKDFMYILEEESITHIHDDLNIELSAIDESLEEFNSYQYDRINSLKTGIDCFIKDLDHSIDASRYLFIEWKEKGKLPII